MRTHLQRLAASTGKVDPRLLATVPREGLPVWEAFCSLCVGRRSGLAFHPLTFVDIEAWCRLQGVRLTPWELDTLLQLDAITQQLAAKHERARKDSRP